MKKRFIDILRLTPLRGPSSWTYPPVIEALVDIGEFEDHPSNTLPGFYERLSSWLPTLVEHRCSYGVRGGFLRRLREGTWVGHILEHVTLELQSLAGVPAGFGKARETSERGVYKVVVSAPEFELGKPALYCARDLIMAAIEDRPFDVEGRVATLRELADRVCLGPSTACIVEAAATERRIPAIRLNDGNLVQLGYGSRQKRIWTAETELTSALAEGIACDKELTRQLLQTVGVPVPEGRRVDDAGQAWEVAQEIGLPVVIKPCDGNHGRGVFTRLTTREQVAAAWEVAAAEGSGVIVERFITGNEHRLLIVGGQLVAAARGEPAWVTGDGEQSIEKLIALQLNTDPRRGRGEDSPLNPVRIDSAARIELANQGFEADSVPPAGTRVLIQRNGNVAIDVTEAVHPSVAAAAALAARTVGLDIAGIDLVAEDISQPLEAQGGGIVEVNAGPGLLMHLKPAEGQPRPVGRAIVDHLFPDDESGRIPVVGITGRRGGATIAHLVARLMRLAGQRTGLACADGLYLDGRTLEQRDCTDFESGHRLLLNRLLDAAVIENGARTIATEGLAYDRCRIGIVTSVECEDALPERDITEIEQVYDLLRTQVDVVLADGASILNAADPLAVRMAALSDGEVILYAADPALPAIDGHRARGGRSVHTRNGLIVLAQGGTETIVTHLDSVMMLDGSDRPFALEAVLAATAAGWALGLPLELLRVGIESAQWEGEALPTQATLANDDPATTRHAPTPSARERRVAA
ncbi:MAG: cyanophycin synthetase [Burkholderiaceae bacterium]